MELEKFPDCLSEEVKKVLAEEGEWKLGSTDNHDLLGPHQVKEKFVYEGEWYLGMRNGYGKQSSDGGELYEG